MNKNYPLIVVAFTVLVLGGCASTTPAPAPTGAEQVEPTAVACDETSPCEGTLKQRYEYYLGMWTTIFF